MASSALNSVRLASVLVHQRVDIVDDVAANGRHEHVGESEGRSLLRLGRLDRDKGSGRLQEVSASGSGRARIAHHSYKEEDEVGPADKREEHAKQEKNEKSFR